MPSRGAVPRRFKSIAMVTMSVMMVFIIGKVVWMMLELKKFDPKVSAEEVAESACAHSHYSVGLSR